ncbi:MAG: DUF2786 domain-containing protein [Candidatus Dormibacteria bacterium]
MGDAGDRVVERIRKLQQLSRSSNEHEAAAAAAKMQELLFDHNLSIESLNDPAEWVEEKREIGARVWARRLYITICRNNFCEPLLGYGGRISAIGKRENVQSVNAVFIYLVREIERIAGTAYAGYRGEAPWPETAREWKAAFRLGAVAAIIGRLRAQRATDVQKIEAAVIGGESGTAIITRLDLALKAEVARRYPFLRTAPQRASRISSGAGYSAGVAAGTRMSLSGSRGHLDSGAA